MLDMDLKRIFWVIVFLAILPATLIAWFTPPAFAAILRVPQDYPTIQAAINAAKAGDVIEVAAGTYYENVIVNVRDIAIVGESRVTTTVDGGRVGSVFNIQATGVEIRGFTLRNGGSRYYGVYAALYGGAGIRDNRIVNNVIGVLLSESDGNTVEGNDLLDNSMYGIDVITLGGNIIRNNTVTGGGYGIELSDSPSNQVTNNTISDTSYGVYVAYSNNNNVSDNTLYDNSWNIYLGNSNDNDVGKNDVSGGSAGIQVVRSQGNSVFNNTASGSSYGIYLAHCGANTVSGNTASLNDWGIELYNSTGSTVNENTVQNNTWGFYLAENSKGNYIYHNNIISNVKQSFQDMTSSPNTWNTPTTPYQGSYWSDYKGSDTNGDGIGDTYLPWGGVDWYPLMTLFGLESDVAILSVVPSSDRTYLGFSINVTVVAKNLGSTAETFNVTAYYSQSVIGTKKVVSLAPRTDITLIFTWNTTGASIGYYVISANATVVPFETNIANNSLTDGAIHVRIPGDINGDDQVDIFDGVLLSLNYGKPASEFPDGDINGDGDINILDAIIIVAHWTG